MERKNVSAIIECKNMSYVTKYINKRNRQKQIKIAIQIKYLKKYIKR